MSESLPGYDTYKLASPPEGPDYEAADQAWCDAAMDDLQALVAKLISGLEGEMGGTLDPGDRGWWCRSLEERLLDSTPPLMVAQLAYERDVISITREQMRDRWAEDEAEQRYNRE